MKKLLSIHYNAFSFNAAMLFLRTTMGLLMMTHGYDKLVHFNENKLHFYNFLGLGSTTSLILTIFAEFFCALFISIGLFTRVLAVPLVINMIVVVFKVHNMDFFGKAELGGLYLAGFLVLLLCGPGRVSVDGIASK
jgi:putative oxidoreductase